MVKFVVFDFDVLVERSFRPVGALAGLHGAAVVPLYLIGSPAETFLLIIVPALSLLNITGLAF